MKIGGGIHASRLARVAAAVGAFALLLSACVSGTNLEEAMRPDPLDRATNADLSARTPSGGGFLAGLGFGRSGNRQAQIYTGSGNGGSIVAQASQMSGVISSGETFEVNLDNAEVAVAARTILGEILRISYVIDPRVAGQVSIVTARPAPAAEILTLFEAALRSNDTALVREGDRFRLMLAADAMGVAQLDQGVTIQPGYGVTVLPLRHVSAANILPLLENFVTRQGMVREHSGGNALIFQGTAAERRAGIEAARSFDQDWLADQSVGLFPIENSTPQAMIPELERVLDLREGGRGRNTISLQPIDRTNTIMVVARSSSQLQRAASWIKRLDTTNVAGSNLRVYRVQHVDARRLASMVNAIFVGGASAQEDPSQQFPPGSSPTMQQGEELTALASTGSESGDVPSFGGAGNSFGAQNSAFAGGQDQGFSMGGGGGQGALLQNVRITANQENNSILIYARPDQQQVIEQAIMALDRPSAQVAIEATIAEVVLTNELRYGVQFFLKSRDLGGGDDDGSIGLFRDVGEAALSRVLPGFNLLLGPETDPRLIIDALRGVTEVKILSSPSVVVMDNRPASLQVGDEVPIVTRTAQSITDPDAPVVNNVEFRNTGVILNVLPRITANGTINLLVEQEISSVARGSASLTPTISQRKVNSTVSIASGQTVLLGGLISERQTKGREGIPILGDAPIIGDLFRTNTNNATRTELIVLIRPQIIRDSLDAQNVAEQMRSQLRLMNTPGRNVPLPPPAQTLIE
ncbi:type II secretion system protein GspD [Mesorhizobium microcysteis]|uniref:Type II secretion system protein GspD n=1 Tax=Neoaquamicrobium microcysteis TaxID=2682781 RepID=A0A5D4GNX2_9HYPH|nr:type II secretion system secretin GspD [Mesorhizobium microcysteis]TYR30067.1 type II secretion system protein GspD [Mesorhizobium microcysteis]